MNRSPDVFTEVALGAGLLVVLHFAGLGAVLLGAALCGAPSGDFQLVTFASAMYLLVFPMVQLVYAAVAAGWLRKAGRPSMALGVTITAALTLALGCTCAAVVMGSFELHP